MAEMFKYDIGIVHGRFQILHNDHVKYILAGKALCRNLIVGVTNPEPALTRHESADPNRSNPISNPLTYYERYNLIRLMLIEQDQDPNRFAIVPFPINFPERYHYYVPMDAVFFLTIYDDWGRRKLDYFKSLGLKINVLWEKAPADKGISSTDIRQRIMDNAFWKDLVPESVYAYLSQLNIRDRLERLSQSV